ncbi:MAG TPA: transglycosylase SLT domain-containing protein [Acidimicrobiia bacterium]|nr:transglycosylase SLT domain-containing protein [Acidimicrobiia bacterium]
MALRRGLAALTVASMLLASVAPVSAQVDEAEQRARDAGEQVERAYAVVSSAQADASAVEAALFTALDEYQMAATDLAAAGIRLQRISDALVFADAEAINAAQRLESHTVAAYMQAVTSTASIVFDTESVEEAIFVGQVVRESQANALTTLSDLISQRSELERIRAEHAVEVVQVESLEQQLAAHTDALQELFVAANAEVAAAFAIAAEADAAFRAALDGVDRALAETEAARRADDATTTTTAPPTDSSPTTTSSGSPTTTGSDPTTTTSTTAPAADWPPIPINDRVMALRPLVERHFAADLVLDALVIIQCESLGNPDAVNPYSGASGLFQFIPGTWAVASVQAGVGGSSVFDPEANIIAASWLAEYYRDRTGNPWRPWSCASRL